jgi:nucleoside-diphosphate-sugar epimerase
MKRILVTGANGYIGVALCQHLTQLGHEVVPAVRIPSKLSNEVVTGALESFDSWRKVLIDVDVLVHLAGRAHVLNDRVADPLAIFRQINTQGTKLLAEHAVTAGVKRIVFMSSIGVNGNSTHERPFHHDDEPHPQSDYAVSKFEAEQALSQIAKTSKLELVVIRPPLVYGGNAPGNFATLMRWLLKGVPLPFGSVTGNRRNFVSLENLMSLVSLCVDHPAAIGQTFLASDSEYVSTTELLTSLSNALGKRPLLLPVPPRSMEFVAKAAGRLDLAQRLLGNLQIDIEHTRTTVGWKPPLSVHAGLRKAAQDYLTILHSGQGI